MRKITIVLLFMLPLLTLGQRYIKPQRIDADTGVFKRVAKIGNYYLPVTSGTARQVLTTNGGSVASWQAVAVDTNDLVWGYYSDSSAININTNGYVKIKTLDIDTAVPAYIVAVRDNSHNTLIKIPVQALLAGAPAYSDTTGLDPLCEGLTIYSLADSTMWQHRPVVDTTVGSPTYGDTVGCEWVDVSTSPLVPNPTIVMSNGALVPFSTVPTIRQRVPVQFLKKSVSGGTEWIVGVDTVTTKGVATQYDISVIDTSKWGVSGSDIYNKNAGNVGVGTNTPARKFTVNGDFMLQDTTDVYTVTEVSGNDNGIVLSRERYFEEARDSLLTETQVELNPTTIINKVYSSAAKNRVYTYLSADDNSFTGQNNIVAGYIGDSVIQLGSASSPWGKTYLKKLYLSQLPYTGDISLRVLAWDTVGGEVKKIPISALVTDTSGWNIATKGYVTGITNLKANISDTGSYLLSRTRAASTYEPKIAAGTTGQYWRGDKTWQTLPSAVAADSVPFTRNNSRLTTWLRYSDKLHIGSSTTPDSTFQVTGGAKFTRDIVVNGVRVGRGKGDVSTNVAVGDGTLFTNNTGLRNTAIGSNVLYKVSTGADNTGVGESVLYNNTGSQNTAMGRGTLYTNTTGTYNTGVGMNVLFYNSTGGWNTALGNNALNQNRTSNNNTAIGNNASYSNTTGYSNVAVGVSALYSNTTASNLVAVGDSALYTAGAGGTPTGATAIGSKALYKLNTGTQSTAVGYNAGYNATGSYNTFLGYQSGYTTSTGTSNTYIGTKAGYYTTQGYENIAVGNQAGYRNTTGYYNVFLGSGAGSTVSGGASNETTDQSIFIGAGSQSLSDGRTNQIVIGRSAIGKGSNTTTIGNTSVTDTYLSGALTVDSIPNDVAPDSIATVKNGKLYRALFTDATAKQDSVKNPWYYSSGNTIQRSTGNVGVGSTNPMHKLVVVTSNATNTNGINIVNSDANKNRSTLVQAVDTSSFNFNYTPLGKPQLTINGATGQIYMKIDSAGRVGIGTSAPTAKLHVSGRVLSDTTQSAFVLGGSAVGSTITYQNTTGNGGTTGIAHQWKSGNNGGTVDMTILNDGKVGIGTTAPSVNGVLTVNGNITVLSNQVLAGTFYGTSAYLQNYTTQDNATTELSIFTRDKDAAYIRFGKGNDNTTFTTEFARFNTSGNLGIGTTAPAYKLEIQGKKTAPFAVSADNDGTFGDSTAIVTTAAGKVGIGTTAITSNLTVGGSMTIAYRAITALRTLDATDYFVDCTANTFNVTLPTAALIPGRVYVVKNSGTGVITIDCTSGQTIDGSATVTLSAQYSSVTVVSDGTNWKII